MEVSLCWMKGHGSLHVARSERSWKSPCAGWKVTGVSMLLDLKGHGSLHVLDERSWESPYGWTCWMKPHESLHTAGFDGWNVTWGSIWLDLLYKRSVESPCGSICLIKSLLRARLNTFGSSGRKVTGVFICLDPLVEGHGRLHMAGSAGWKVTGGSKWLVLLNERSRESQYGWICCINGQWSLHKTGSAGWKVIGVSSRLDLLNDSSRESPFGCICWTNGHRSLHVARPARWKVTEVSMLLDLKGHGSLHVLHEERSWESPYGWICWMKGHCRVSKVSIWLNLLYERSEVWSL
jgi:hypothetical protein